MLSCDTLYDDTVADSALEAYTVYGDTCAGRQPENTQRYCRDVLPRRVTDRRARRSGLRVGR